MESRFNVGDTIVYQGNDGKFAQGKIKEIWFSYFVESNDELHSHQCVFQDKVYKDKQEVINSLGLNDK